MSTQPREKNPNWKGGRPIASNGYVLVKVGTDHHLADVRGYAYEHRIVAERKIGRRLRRGEIVHHIDGNKANNAEANIEVHASTAHHFVEHRSARSRERLRKPGDPNPLILCGCGCGEEFERFDKHRRPRAFISGHNPHEATTREAVIRALASGPKSRAALAKLVGTTVGAVGCALTILRRVRRAEPIGRGIWKATA